MKWGWLVAAMLAGCGEAVVDGSCADGYAYCDGACRIASACSPADAAREAPDAAGDALDDSGFADTLADTFADTMDARDPLGETTACEPPTTACPAGCVDLDVDPNNCGACGHVCPTGLCNGGKCRGAKAGHVVVAGHDYLGAAPALAVSRVLANAVFLPGKNPVRVLSFESYSEASSVASVKAILDEGAASSGRTYVKSTAASLADFRDRLLIDSFDVALIFDQPKAPPGVLRSVGCDMKLSLDSFSRVGGVVVVLDAASGVAEMSEFLTASTMLETSAHAVVTGKTVDVVAPGDAIGIGVFSPYLAPTRSVSFSVSEPPSASLVTVVSEPDSGKPVVLHKVVFR